MGGAHTLRLCHPPSIVRHAFLIQVAFSQIANRKAWQLAGLYEKGGITQRPYWVQLRAEQPLQPATQQKRGRSRAAEGAAERACAALGLGPGVNTADWRPPYEDRGKRAERLAGADGALVHAEADGAEGEAAGALTDGSIRSGDVSQIGCAVTDPPAQKMLRFKRDMNVIKSMQAQQLKDALLAIGLGYPGNMDKAKVTLLFALETTYAATPTQMLDGTPFAVSFKICKAWLPKNLLAIMYPEDEGEAPKKQKKAPAPLGAGAYVCGGDAPAEGAPLLLKPTDAQLALLLPAPAPAPPAAQQPAALPAPELVPMVEG